MTSGNYSKPSDGTGNILKDSYYKERLLNSKGTSMYKNSSAAFQTGHMLKIASYSDSDEQSENEEPQPQDDLEMKKILQRFGKTAEGSSYGFLDFICTHKKLKSINIIKHYQYLEKIDLSYNSLTTLRFINGLKYLTEIIAVNNQLTNVLGEVKYTPLYLDTIDLSYNSIVKIPSLSRHQHLRVLKLKGNKIEQISGFEKNPKLEFLDLCENQIEEIKGLDRLDLKELLLSNNQIEVIKNLQKLENLRVLELSLNKISKMKGLVNLVSLRSLDLAKNSIKHTREIQYLENLMYLNNVNLCFNPIQERKYYRIQIIYKLPMLEILDGVNVTGQEVSASENFYGLDTEERYKIFNNILPEEEFVDRRVFKSELLSNETDSEGEANNFVDEYDEEGRMTRSNRSWSKGSKGFGTSKRSVASKGSKISKGSNMRSDNSFSK